MMFTVSLESQDKAEIISALQNLIIDIGNSEQFEKPIHGKNIAGRAVLKGRIKRHLDKGKFTKIYPEQ
jgi:hypothetical protein